MIRNAKIFKPGVLSQYINVASLLNDLRYIFITATNKT